MSAVNIIPDVSIMVLLLCAADVSCSRAPQDTREGITRVWAVDDGEKVRQDDLTHWAATSKENPVWDGQKITVFGARNEIVAVQVVIEAGGKGAQKVDVILDTLSTIGGVIANARGITDPFDYVGKHIEMFVENYQFIPERSPFVHALGKPRSRPLPDELHQGWIPDALVPFSAKNSAAMHGQGGAPFDIAGGKNQAVWVDIYVPRSAVPGVYKGNVVITERDSVRRRIPVELKVYGFSLPDETHQQIFVHWTYELITNRYGIALNSPAYWTMFQKFMNFAHRHRIDLTDGRRALGGDEGFAHRLGGYYTGVNYTTAFQYEGPGEGKGNRVYSIGTYDQPAAGFVSGFYPDTREAWQSAADQWEQWFVDHAPDVLRFKYMDDEGDVKNPSVVNVIRQKCQWMISNPGRGRTLHRFFTKEFVSESLFGAIDFWALSGSPGITKDLMAERKTRDGELFCMYNGTRPMWGQMEVIDNFATDNRVNPWIAWKYGVDLMFYWASAFYAEERPPHPAAVNVWKDNYLPRGRRDDPEKYWGAGMLFYPGKDVAYPDDDRGVEGPIGCIRMQNMRRGLQDGEYLWLAKQNGVNVQSIVDGIVPHALDDWGESTYTNPPGFNQQPVYPTQGFVYERARRALADSLSAVLVAKGG